MHARLLGSLEYTFLQQNMILLVSVSISSQPLGPPLHPHQCRKELQQSRGHDLIIIIVMALVLLVFFYDLIL